MKIIAGKYKGQKIDYIVNKDIRPTKARVREALFSILSSGKFLLNGKTVLEDSLIADIYCGTGSISMEALSRGAKHAILVDNNPKHLALAKNNLLRICDEDNYTIIRADGRFLPKLRSNIPEIVFIDPPYGKDMIKYTLKSLYIAGWINNKTIIIFEMPAKDNLELDSDNMHIITKNYGNSKIIICSQLH